MKLSIIVPTYNEELTVEQLIHRIQAVTFPVDYEIIVVDDASIDRTYEKEILTKLADQSHRIRIYKNDSNRGKGYSVRRGIQYAQGDIIIVQDADHEYDPQEIPALIQPILGGEEAVVYGSRFLHAAYPKGMAFANWMANRFLTWLTNALYGLKLTDMETCYKVIRADLLKALELKEDRFAFEPEVTALLAQQRIRIKELPISYNGRGSKEGKKIKAIDFVFALKVLLRRKISTGERKESL